MVERLLRMLLTELELSSTIRTGRLYTLLFHNGVTGSLCLHPVKHCSSSSSPCCSAVFQFGEEITLWCYALWLLHDDSY